MAGVARGPHPVHIRRTRPHISPPLIGILTHELRGEPAPAWAPIPGRTARDENPHRLAMRLTYTQAIDLIAGLGKRARIAGFDLVELYPPADMDGLSALTAARLVVNVIGAIARQV